MVQAKDLGVSSAFKTCNLRRTFALLLPLRKTLLQFWKDYNIYYCIENLALALGNITKDCMNGIWKKTLSVFVHGFKGFAKDEEVANINKAVIEMTNNVHLCVEEGDIEKLPGIVPEELSDEELLELE